MTDEKLPRRLILVADDEPDMLEGLSDLLEETGSYSVLRASDGVSAHRMARDKQPDLLVLDIQMPGMTGIEVFRALREEGIEIPAIIVTGHGDAQDAFAAFRYGIAAFISKHRFDPEQFLEEVERLVRLHDVVRRDRSLRAFKSRKLKCMIGTSKAMERVRELISRAAPSHAPVLITGPSGTGKELAAQMIHDLSPRAAGPFVPVNCAAIPESLIESSLFGHRKGSFTGADQDRKGSFEEADGGTLFLDEIADMSLATQAKILRALQEQLVEPVGSSKACRVDVRVVTATNKILAEEIAEGRFREDLFFRINVIEIELPPLADRISDVPELIAHFADELARDSGITGSIFSPEAVEILASEPWKGNIRELRNAVQRLMIMTAGSTIEPEDVSALIRRAPRKDQAGEHWPSELETLQDFQIWSEARFVLDRIKTLRAGWTEGSFSVSRAAEKLGISKSQIYKILDKAKQHGWIPNKDLRDLIAL